MKTFAFTIPEPRLSSVEKRQHCETKNDPKVTLGYWDDQHQLTERGITYLEQFEETGLNNFHSFRRIFLRQNLIEGAVRAGCFYFTMASLISLITLSFSPFAKMAPILPVSLATYVAIAMFRVRKFYQIEQTLYTELRHRSVADDAS